MQVFVSSRATWAHKTHGIPAKFQTQKKQTKGQITPDFQFLAFFIGGRSSLMPGGRSRHFQSK